MTPAPVIPIREQAPRPTWTISGGPPPEAIRGWATLCLDVARKRLRERARAEAAGDQHMEDEP